MGIQLQQRWINHLLVAGLLPGMILTFGCSGRTPDKIPAAQAVGQGSQAEDEPVAIYRNDTTIAEQEGNSYIKANDLVDRERKLRDPKEVPAEVSEPSDGNEPPESSEPPAESGSEDSSGQP